MKAVVYTRYGPPGVLRLTDVDRPAPKRHWNTVTLDGSVPDEEVLELIHHSYDLVVARLTKAQRNQLMT